MSKSPSEMIRDYGWYTNRARGDRVRSQMPAPAAADQIAVDDEDTPYRKLCRMGGPRCSNGCTKSIPCAVKNAAAR